jgi:hypothetical protein
MTQTNSKLHLPSLFYLIFSGCGLLFTLAVGVIVLLSSLVGVVGGETRDFLYPGFVASWTLIGVSVLLVPGIVYAILRLMDRPFPEKFVVKQKYLPVVFLGLWLPLLALGGVLSRKASGDWLLLPALTVFLIAIPLWIWIRLGNKGIQPEDKQATWSLLGINMLVTPAFVMVVELIVIMMIVLVGIIVIFISPALTDEFTKIIQLMNSSSLDPVLIMHVIKPLMQNPWVIFSILGTMSIFIPIVEELLKPIWMWAFVKKVDPSQGFLYGMFCGAAFALIESIGYMATPMDEAWAGLMIGRVGTGLLHVVTSGLVGWGLASAWHDKKYFRLAKAYFLAVFIHGLWNAIGLLMGFVEYLEPVNQLNLILTRIGEIAPFALFTFSCCMVIFLVIARNRLKSKSGSETPVIPVTEMRIDLDNPNSPLKTE